MMLGAIEAGGTKFVLAAGTSPDVITARQTIPTRDPATTLAQAAAWFAGQGQFTAIGIGSFGPIELDRRSSRWGFITNTPKPGWADCDIAGYFRARLGVPVGFDTDVNAAALAEYAAAQGEGCSSLAYLTIGTGIGGGLVLGGKPVHGAAHPEMGHIYPRRHPLDRDFAGVCPHHGDCLEGLASGPAIMTRWGASLSEFPQEHPSHAIIADYIAQACHTLFAAVAAERIVIGGGVAKTGGLVERIRARTAELGANYLPGSACHHIRTPHHGDNAGIIGAMTLANAALSSQAL
ncbi:ROK family protein [Erythrobacter sp.]|uniref:ROK family protein n=1 Tax=Erythrobacter sp. TaxID=1042 RepID=UPI0025CBFE7E|nr:ROK family protein [Erythrobacter sp.]